ncbi:DUF2269 family protein [Pigmentiphaga soli]|uniref:DUF2269 family protein n=1 Tax=Pigmentiphaga soli TaxID=1007095 RepID=A0ABP8GKK7_9BURK
MEYALTKWIHILSSTLLFGTGIGSAFYLLAATLGRDPRTVAAVAGYVVIADALFTATTAVIQPLTGWWMMHAVGMAFAGWLRWSVGLYVAALACWLPVVWLQVRLRDLARAAAARGEPLPAAYWRLFRIWVALGVPAFAAFLAIFYLMTAKPS